LQILVMIFSLLQILISFFAVHMSSKKFSDRTLVIVGLIVEAFAVGWLLYWMPIVEPVKGKE